MINTSKTDRFVFRILVAAFIFTLIIFNYAPNPQSRAAGRVDLVLLLAMDVSASVNITEFDLMREGLANAIASPEIAQAVSAGKIGAIAINVVQWSGFQEQQVMIGWTKVSTPRELGQLAAKIRTIDTPLFWGSHRYRWRVKIQS